MEKKDDRIADYRDQITQMKLDNQEATEKMKNDYEERLSKLEEDSGSTIERLQMRLKIAEDELTMLNEFKEVKEVVEKKLRAKEDELARAIQKHELEANKMERKFLEEKNRMRHEHEAHILKIKQTAREEAQKGLAADTRKIVTDNRRMGEELRFQLRATEELQADKAKVEEENRRLRRDLVLAEEKEKLYAKKGYSRNKETKELQAKVKALERSLSQVVRDFEKEQEVAELKSRQVVEELELSNSGSKQLLKLKNRELKNVRRLAQVILDQRTEVEQYFLDALEQVKGEIRKRREDEYRLAMSEYNSAIRRAMSGAKGAKFPQIKALSQMLSDAGSSIIGGESGIEGGSSRMPAQPNQKSTSAIWAGRIGRGCFACSLPRSTMCRARQRPFCSSKWNSLPSSSSMVAPTLILNHRAVMCSRVLSRSLVRKSYTQEKIRAREYCRREDHRGQEFALQAHHRGRGAGKCPDSLDGAHIRLVCVFFVSVSNLHFVSHFYYCNNNSFCLPTMRDLKISQALTPSLKKRMLLRVCVCVCVCVCIPMCVCLCVCVCVSLASARTRLSFSIRTRGWYSLLQRTLRPLLRSPTFSSASVSRPSLALRHLWTGALR